MPINKLDVLQQLIQSGHLHLPGCSPMVKKFLPSPTFACHWTNGGIPDCSSRLWFGRHRLDSTAGTRATSCHFRLSSSASAAAPRACGSRGCGSSTAARPSLRTLRKYFCGWLRICNAVLVPACSSIFFQSRPNLHSLSSCSNVDLAQNSSIRTVPRCQRVTCRYIVVYLPCDHV